jgi:hypothetical protein
MPPLHGTGFTDMMAGTARSLGWHPFPGPAAVTSVRYQGRAACAYHGFCNRGGCHVSAKGSTAVTTIPKAQRTKRLAVVTEAHVTAITWMRRAGERGHVSQGRDRVLPAGARGPARGLHLRERPAAAALDVSGVSERAVEQSRPGGAALLQP